MDEAQTYDRPGGGGNVLTIQIKIAWISWKYYLFSTGKWKSIQKIPPKEWPRKTKANIINNRWVRTNEIYLFVVLPSNKRRTNDAHTMEFGVSVSLSVSLSLGALLILEMRFTFVVAIAVTFVLQSYFGSFGHRDFCVFVLCCVLYFSTVVQLLCLTICNKESQ